MAERAARVGATLRISSGCIGAIRAHAERAFPRECCGALLGREHGDAREVARVLELDNAHGDGREPRFLIAPRALLEVEKTARRLGLTVIGIYHSHPNRPPTPSELDRAHANPYWSYLIVSCMQGRAIHTQSWRLCGERGLFEEEVIG